MIFIFSGQNYGNNRNNYPQCPIDLRCQSRLLLSEVMTIVIAFDGSGFRTFEGFYTRLVLPYWRKAFPKLVSYNRFVELMPGVFNVVVLFPTNSERRSYRDQFY